MDETLIAKIPQQEDMETPWFRHICAELKIEPAYHRKYWELSEICRALRERNLLIPGKKGIGFGVGLEPLGAYFVKRGCKVIVSDCSPRPEWSETGQHCCGDVELLNKDGIADESSWFTNARYRTIDMNDIPWNFRQGQYDFCWSANSLDHLGSIEAGLQFLERCKECLKPGGVSVHTTEYNLSSNEETHEVWPTVFYRKKDIQRIVPDFDPVWPMGDRMGISKPPYTGDHMLLENDGWIVTSVLILDYA